jgi:DNA-binding beta-propeller fold protein YncE
MVAGDRAEAGAAVEETSLKFFMKNFILFVTAAFAIALTPGRSATWTVSGSIPLGGEGRWDYAVVDEPNQRVFVAHENHVLVVDLKTEKVTASQDSARAHGTALVPEFNRGYFSNGNSGEVTVFDLTTLKPIQSVKAGQHPDCVRYEPATKRVFVFNGLSHTATVIDGATGNVAGEIPLPGKPEFAATDGRGFVYDDVEDKGLVVKIDAARMAIVAEWSLPPGNEPSALALDAVRGRLFVGCGSKKLFVLNSETGAVVAAFPIGGGIDADYYDATGQRVFASCGDGTLTVIKQSSADSYAVEQVVKTAPGARTMAFDSATQTAYLPDVDFGPAPAPTEGNPHPRATPLPNSFRLLVVRQKF